MEYCMTFKYFALQASGECRCGNDYSTAEQYGLVADDECDGGQGKE
jgi:hypothetical protein